MPPPTLDTAILVPPSRLGPNVLARMLAARGARVLEFPALRAAEPHDLARLDDAAGDLADFDWILFSGERAVDGFLARLRLIEGAIEPPARLRVAAIGGSAVRALGERGIEVSYAPSVHTAAEIARGLGELQGLSVLLVREETARDALPRELRAAGASIVEVPGFRVAVDAAADAAARVAAERPGTVALANPTAVRFLDRALTRLALSLERWLPDARVAAVGPETAAAAREHGLAPRQVASGRLQQLVELLVSSSSANQGDGSNQ